MDGWRRRRRRRRRRRAFLRFSLGGGKNEGGTTRETPTLLSLSSPPRARSPGKNTAKSGLENVDEEEGKGKAGCVYCAREFIGRREWGNQHSPTNSYRVCKRCGDRNLKKSINKFAPERDESKCTKKRVNFTPSLVILLHARCQVTFSPPASTKTKKTFSVSAFGSFLLPRWSRWVHRLP